MNILITGGAGFIGSNLIDKIIAENHNIIVVDNFNDLLYDSKIKENNIKHNLSRIKLYRIDIRNNLDKVFENKIDCVIHLGAVAGVRPSIENPKLYADINIMGTLNILEQMRKNNIKKIIFASSSSVYGNCNAEKFTEDLNINKPISPYAMTKIAGETLCYNYSHLYNISAICLRFFTVYGARQRPDLAIHKFANLIEQEREITLFGDGETMRDYTYIDDICDGIIRAIDYDKTNYEIINLASGNPITLNNMVTTLSNVMGKKALIKRMPMQAGDVDRTSGDITKAKQLLGYIPKLHFEDGIKNFIEWRNNNKKVL